jgi:hypothetical protein
MRVYAARDKLQAACSLTEASTTTTTGLDYAVYTERTKLDAASNLTEAYAKATGTNNGADNLAEARCS